MNGVLRQMKLLVKQIVRKCGLEVHRYRTSSAAKLQKILLYHKIDLVLDIGANIGQYARELRSGGYKGRIVSFEPLSSAHRELMRTSRQDDAWTIAPQVAIGDEDGEITINISSNSYSSSVLDILDLHVDNEPSAAVVSREKVKMSRLDTIVGPYINESKSIFLKIDTQGFEAQVLDGAAQSLAAIRGLQIELSLVPLYKGQTLFLEMIEKIQKAGFELYGLVPGFTDINSGRLLQADGIFIKKN